LDLEVIRMNRYYPLMLNLSGKRCLVVGGGKVAERKTALLLESGANVTVISPECTETMEAWASDGRISYVNRGYEKDDLRAGEAYALIIAATNSPAANEQVFEDSKDLQPMAWINIADRPELSTFIVPSMVRRGKLTLAVSTEGASPSVARKLVRELEKAYGDEYEQYLNFLSEVRLKVQCWVEDKQRRQEMFKLMLNWDVISLIKRERFEAWKLDLLEALEQNPSPATVIEFAKRG
jgi:precorrin-2 dehydrogenase / sirohydrochlorin ferrochelatase